MKINTCFFKFLAVKNQLHQRFSIQFVDETYTETEYSKNTNISSLNLFDGKKYSIVYFFTKTRNQQLSDVQKLNRQAGYK